jgi:hypothetical protein
MVPVRITGMSSCVIKWTNSFARLLISYELYTNHSIINTLQSGFILSLKYSIVLFFSICRQTNRMDNLHVRLNFNRLSEDKGIKYHS